jgi:hypothetical protein
MASGLKNDLLQLFALGKMDKKDLGFGFCGFLLSEDNSSYRKNHE